MLDDIKFFALLKICKSTVIHQYLFLYVAIYSVKSYNTMGYILRTRKFPNTTEDTKWYLQVWSSIIVIIWTEHQIALQSQLGKKFSRHDWITYFLSILNTLPGALFKRWLQFFGYLKQLRDFSSLFEDSE